MIHRGEVFPYIHDLKKLLAILETNGVRIPKYVWQSHVLTEYAWKTRYPSPRSAVSLRAYRRAVRIATGVLRWAERQIAKPKP